MNNNTNDETLKEILKEEEKAAENPRKKRGCFFRSLVFLIILLVGILAFVFIQQYFLDLEAQAIVSAARTATAQQALSGNMAEEEKGAEEVEVVDPTETPLPSPTATDDPAFERTATIAVQLTEVAAFQLTATANP